MELLRSVESLHHLRSLEWAFHQCLNSAYVGYTTQQSSLDRSQKCRFALEEIPLKIDEAARTLGESGQSFEGLDMDSEMDNLDSLQISFGKLNAIWHLLEVLAYSPTQQLSADFTAWLKSLARVDIVSPDSFGAGLPAERHPQYWDTMVALALRGLLTEVIELLCLHSEIGVVVQNGSSSSVQSYVTGVDRNQVNLLLELLDTHPYSKASELGGTQQHALRLWQDRVRGLHESLSAGEGTLLRRIPTLDTVLRILLGEEALLTHQATRARHSSWATLALAQLYYVYAPPLSRENILEVVERSLQAVDGSASLSESDVLYLAVLRKALRGSVVEALVALYRLAQRENLGLVTPTATAVRRDHRLATTAFLQGVLHLTLSLVGSERHDELLQPLLDAPIASGNLAGSKRTRPATNAVTGLNLQQLLAQELAQSLNALQFPPQTVVDYARLVGRPLAGELLITLLTRRTYVSDRSARQAAQILHGLGLVRASQEVLTLRGMYWLQGRSLATLPNPLASTSEKDKNSPSSPLKLQTGFAPAAAFFAQAQHWRKTQRIVQFVFRQLTWTVTQCHNLFPELSLPPSDNAEDLLTHHSQQQQSTSHQTVSEAVQRLVQAAEEVEHVLAAILCDVSLLSEASEHNLVSEVAALQRYHAAVLACLRFHAASGSASLDGSSLMNRRPASSSSSGHGQKMDVVGDAVDTEVLLQSAPHLRAVREAALQLVSLLTGCESEDDRAGSSAWNTPFLLRFRLHTLQLSGSLHALVTQTELAQSLSVTFLSHVEQLKEQDPSQSSLSAQWTRGIYSQTQTEIMLQQIYHQVEAAILEEVAIARLGVDGAARETLQRDILQPLRLQLTGLWTTATHVASLQVVTQRRQSTTAVLSTVLPSNQPSSSSASTLRVNSLRRTMTKEAVSTTEAVGRYRRLVLPGAAN